MPLKTFIAPFLLLPLLLLVPQYSKSANGGPDALGYGWQDSLPYSWVDITSTGTQVTGLADDNSVLYQLTQGYFRYYGNMYDQIRIGSNGWLRLGQERRISPAAFPRCRQPAEPMAIIFSRLS